MASGALFVDHTTASAEVARELYQQAKQKGIGFVDAPVSGGQAGAVNGKLTVMCGGEQAHFDTIQPLAYNFAQAVTLLGASGSGQLARSEEHTSELQSLMRISYAVFCLKKKNPVTANISQLDTQR